jgi:hypothetical protein
LVIAFGGGLEAERAFSFAQIAEKSIRWALISDEFIDDCSDVPTYPTVLAITGRSPNCGRNDCGVTSTGLFLSQIWGWFGAATTLLASPAQLRDGSRSW